MIKVKKVLSNVKASLKDFAKKDVVSRDVLKENKPIVTMKESRPVESRSSYFKKEYENDRRKLFLR